MSAHVLSTTDDQFETEVLKAEIPVLVDFWAEWCGPCRMITPILEQIAEEYAGKIKVIKVDVDQNPNTPSQYGVRGIPNLILFKNGEAVASKVGALTKAQLASFIDEHC